MSRTLDWTKLPPGLEYLARPAERYGPYQFDDNIVTFFREEMTDVERAELREVELKMQKDGKEIEKWIDELGMTRHREAALVYFLRHLIAFGYDSGYLTSVE